MTYAEKLKDPRWQRRRLQVLERAGWKCEFCGDGEKTLHVHHLGYKGQPWDAPDDLLECLCEYHHQFRHDNQGYICALFFGKNWTAKQAAEFYAKIIPYGEKLRGKILGRCKK